MSDRQLTSHEIAAAQTLAAQIAAHERPFACSGTISKDELDASQLRLFFTKHDDAGVIK
jgi:hypothetical protein